MALLSNIGPSGVSSTGTFPIGFILRNSGVLFETPISKFSTNVTSTPEYSATMRVL
uniref:Elongation factor 1-gamma-like protein n=1 Tax=Rhizophora mucronata TaxID=61149 RepID=A0A2P2MBJ4_RHIMU